MAATLCGTLPADERGLLTYTFYDDVIDNAVLRREYAYDTLGNTTMLTQYDAAEGGNIVNQV